MSVKFRLFPIGAFKTTAQEGLFHYEAFAKAIDMALDDLADEAKEQFEKTVATWNNPPTFIIRRNKTNRSITAAGKEGQIYTYVDEGTRVRHALMSRDFKAKTRPGVVGSGFGRGGVVFISKKIIRPGIKARGFSEIIQARQERRWPIRLKQVFDALVHE